MNGYTAQQERERIFYLRAAAVVIPVCVLGTILWAIGTSTNRALGDWAVDHIALISAVISTVLVLVGLVLLMGFLFCVAYAITRGIKKGLR
jgi:hypothetical protein